MNTPTLAKSLLILAFLMPAADAAVIVGNNAPFLGISFGGANFRGAVHFFSPLETTEITSVSVALGSIGTTVTAQLYDTVSNLPGTPIADFGSQFISTSGTFTFTPAAPVALAPSTNYFLVTYCTSCPNSLGWRQSAFVSTVGMPGANINPGLTISSDSGASWQTFVGQTIIFQINGDVVQPVPEPATNLLLGAGLLAAFLARRRPR